MNKSVIFFLGIGAGGIIGGVVGFFLAKKKYEHLADEEVKSVKDSFSKYFEHDKVKEDKPNHMPAPETSSVVQEERKDTPIVDYSARYQSTINGYSSPLIVGNELNKLPETSVVSGDPANIFIITPKEFNESEYNAVTLFYYKDSVLSNDNYETLNAVEITSMIGDQALDSFGTYGTDAVYVQNDNNKTVYEIILEDDNYTDVVPGDAPRDE